MDEQMLEAWRQSDPKMRYACWQELWARLHKIAWRYLSSLAVGSSQIEDLARSVVMDTVVEIENLLQSGRRFEWTNPSAFFAFAAQRLQWRLKDQLRRLSHDALLHSMDLEDIEGLSSRSMHTPEHILLCREEARLVLQCLVWLSEESSGAATAAAMWECLSGKAAVCASAELSADDVEDLLARVDRDSFDMSKSELYDCMSERLGLSRTQLHLRMHRLREALSLRLRHELFLDNREK